MKRIVIAAACAAFIASTPAVASDVSAAFQGFHVGGSLGMETGQFKVSGTGGGGGNSADLGPSGFVAGGNVGYMFTFSERWVVDLEALLDWNTAKATDGNGSITQGMGYGGAVSLGYAFVPNLMAYGKLGYVSSGFKLDPGGGATTSGTEWGYLVGAGMRYSFDENWSAKLEYDYTAYNAFTDTANSISVKPTTNVFRIGVDYRFGGFGNWFN